MNTSEQAMFKPLLETIEDLGKKEKAARMFENKETKVNILELAQMLKLKNDRYKALHEEAEALKSELAKEGEQLYQLMIEANMPSVGIENKTLAPKLYRTASIPENLATEGFKQLRAIGLGAMIKETANAQTLGAEFRRMVESGEAIKQDSEWIYADGPLESQKIAFSIIEKQQIGITEISLKKKGKMKEMRKA